MASLKLTHEQKLCEIVQPLGRKNEYFTRIIILPSEHNYALVELL